jgi:hypothetical protein
VTDADLTALWSAWLRDRAQIHRMINLTSAMFRAHAEAVAAAARRSPPGRVEPIGRVESWEDGRGPNSNVPNGDYGPSAREILERGSFAGMHRGPDGTLEPCDPGVPHQWHDTKDGQMCAACCIERPYPPQIVPPATGGVTHAYPADAMPAGLKKACRPMRECKNHSGGPEGSW